jgi:DNA-binding CsgD family transcriptional regulator
MDDIGLDDPPPDGPTSRPASAPSTRVPVDRPSSAGHGLSASEQHVVDLLRSGLSPKEIARQRVVSIAVVRKHIASGRAKTGARTNLQLIAMTRASPDHPADGRLANHIAGVGVRSVTELVLPEGRLRTIHDRYDLAGFLASAELQPVYRRRAANAFRELADLHGRADLRLVREQVAVGLGLVGEFRRYTSNHDPGFADAFVRSPSIEELATALAGAIVTAHLVANLDDISYRPKETVDGLSRRDAEVIALLAAGLRHGEVAQRLSISTRQLRRHIADAVHRAGVANVQQLVNDAGPHEMFVAGNGTGLYVAETRSEGIPEPTPRQRALLVELCRPQFRTPGRMVPPPSNAQIGVLLKPTIGPERVSDILSALYEKYDLRGTSVQNRLSLVLLAIRERIVVAEDYA